MPSRKSEKEEVRCATPGCWKMAGDNGGSRGFCGACYSGWRRLLELDVAEVASRLLRYRRLTNRVGFAQQQGALAAGAAPIVRKIQSVPPTSQQSIAFGRKYDRPGPTGQTHPSHGKANGHGHALKAAS
jgi:hypothetical protein